jgi:hypothetical protein
MGFRSNHSHPPPEKNPTPLPEKNPAQETLKGVSRLVNPRDDDSEIVAADEEPGERDYLGRLLRVADEALRHFAQGLHRHRRGRIH